MKVFTVIKAQAGKVKDNALEIYAYIFISFGIPAILFIYIDWRAAVSSFIIIQAIIGALAVIATVRGNK